MRRSLTIVILGTLSTAALAIAINVATGGPLPGVLGRYQGWAWPAVAVLVVATGCVTWVDRRADSGSAAHPAPVPPPAELPADIPDFTGRDQLVDQVRQLIEHPERSTAVVIAVLTGMAGIGKTALAVHVAQRVRARFPDGQFYVNLRGAQAQALAPMTVLGTFLTQLGMVDLPDDLDGRARAYRSRVAGRRVLVVLDNAADEEQVRPLLPGSPSCAVLVTSRARLANLAGTRLVVLDVLPADEAVDLLGQVGGRDRVVAERESATEIVRLCGYLPIAIRIAGAVLIRRPQQSLARFAEQLTRQRPLDVLSAEGGDRLRVGFSLSYRSLGEPEQRQFRLLGLLRAPDFPAWVGDVALGTETDPGTRTPMDRLVDAQLLEDDRGLEDSAGQRRYRCHDLLREFAQDQLASTDTPADRRPHWSASSPGTSCSAGSPPGDCDLSTRAHRGRPRQSLPDNRSATARSPGAPRSTGVSSPRSSRQPKLA